MKEATFSVYITRGIVQFATARYGIDGECLCQAVGIDPELLKMPDQQISGTLHSALWQEVVKRTDENFALHLGEAFNLATFGIVGYVLVNCQTYAEVLEKLSRYTRLFSQGAYIHFSVADGLVFCDCDIVEDLKNYLLEQPRYAIESTFASLLTATQVLSGKPLLPHAVWFKYPRPDDISEHERIFATSLHFLMPTNRIIFDANCLNWSVLSANSHLLSVFEQHAQTMLEEMNREYDYTRKVAEQLIKHLKGNLPSIETIARSLAISVRQLQRELQAEGTSYQQILDQARKELALRHLKNPYTPIYDVAFVLGFSEPSAFHRAFKRWTGYTPKAYRSLHS
ncbi:AraC family transcriptional regulator [Nostoc sp. FACHB-152]|uniref:AraC family transcriptional regulator n=1 Tax=unclassified Nostoc TaxID=2593658 RepID=UPI001688541E|nr:MULTISPECIES: AraC family transcriptional regulator [unclassified Nostoc]MBD2452124.1 AraC family transcriptional regulator [Nostoc sp. FACHB-152]MBD2472743.1 AraC family transcriptional regulator [Nostoc sp. FACHB-145]